ncbi:hypothetical protein MTP10_39260 [Nonomuraea sp. 3-1Str]|uniref:hypothetical protein n=1 Tax=Nonomuraea sp. 3-1Str TaxID=2929801 RepID=UPI00285C5650|nr:hypothetical protein [Nonomuraea sp. 3-1Str]MDR8414753.1 hypothetical protein [Nonomuraea sp. 3-1Str]
MSSDTIRDEHAGTFAQRLTHLRERHQGKPSVIKQLNDGGLMAEWPAISQAWEMAAGDILRHFESRQCMTP